MNDDACYERHSPLYAVPDDEVGSNEVKEEDTEGEVRERERVAEEEREDTVDENERMRGTLN